MMNEVLLKILQKRPKTTVAIITPFKDSAKAIQEKFCFDDSRLELSVETIDRVQGATVDYTILYFPLRKVEFSFDEPFFSFCISYLLFFDILSVSESGDLNKHISLSLSS